MNQKKTGHFFKELRKEKGLTQEMLATQFDVTARTISRWETGNNMPDLDILLEMADFYSVDVRELIEGERKAAGLDKDVAEEFAKAVEHDMEMIKILLYFLLDETPVHDIEKNKKKYKKIDKIIYLLNFKKIGSLGDIIAELKDVGWVTTANSILDRDIDKQDFQRKCYKVSQEKYNEAIQVMEHQGEDVDIMRIATVLDCMGELQYICSKEYIKRLRKSSVYDITNKELSGEIRILLNKIVVPKFFRPRDSTREIWIPTEQMFSNKQESIQYLVDVMEERNITYQVIDNHNFKIGNRYYRIELNARKYYQAIVQVVVLYRKDNFNVYE